LCASGQTRDEVLGGQGIVGQFCGIKCSHQEIGLIPEQNELRTTFGQRADKIGTELVLNAVGKIDKPLKVIFAIVEFVGATDDWRQ